MSELYTIKELTGLLKTSDKTIRNEIAKGTLQCCRVGGQIRVSEEQLNSYLNRKGTPNFYKGR